MLASAGRVEQARSALARYVADGETGDDGGGDDRRFVRQLTRWLDAGHTAVPPLAETLRRLPPPPPKRSWSRARQDSRERAAARDAVRAVARGKTREQIGDLLAAEYAARGLDIAQSTLVFGAEMIELEQRPFGKLRGFVRGLQLLRNAGSAAAASGGNHAATDPEWMRPSPRATYRVDTRRPFVAITLNPGAAGVLDRAVAEATRRVGPAVFVDVWLERAGADEDVHVYLGEHDVGALSDEATRWFALDLSAAAELFDEAVRVRAMLTPGATGRSAALEIGKPEHVA